jgi:hypothetical protein
MNDQTPSLDEVKAMIDAPERADRANLRPWMMAHFDENGDEQRRVHQLPEWMRVAD